MKKRIRKIGDRCDNCLNKLEGNPDVTANDSRGEELAFCSVDCYVKYIRKVVEKL